MTTRKLLVAGNWKMNGSLEANKAWAEGFAAYDGKIGCETVVFAPAVYVPQIVALFAGTAVQCGGEDVSAHACGAFTGEVAGPMLRDVGATWVLVGHSERRAMHGETNEIVADKMKAAVEAGLRAMLCVGETLEEREAGKTDEVICGQLRAVIEKIGVGPLVDGAVAYEPVWAIGTGKTATPEMAQQAHAALRAELARYDAEGAQKVRILYGGSVKPKNAGELFGCPDIDGGLVGGASLKADSFAGICLAGQN